MLNQVVLVGRLASNIEIKEMESGKKVANISLAVPRCFKNSEGVYDTDFISITVFDSIAENTAEFCQKGDMVGVKGRVEQLEKRMRIIAEKITFLSTKKEEK